MESESMETRLRRLEDREEIRQLLIEYGRTLDRRNFEAFSKLFARNAEYTGGGGTGAVKGPEAIGRFMEEIFRNNPTGLNYPNFHLFANTTIQVNGDEATALSKGAFVVRGSNDRPETVMLATYHDTLIREDGAWKFRRRVVEGDIPSLSRSQ
ncbi:MAG: nuclear transport factor 2 family protein [Acidobacteria bacterium]|nr:nuclear transport factor 2 family protein [Acidobacteriota bacterium]